jgi:hypothetical protein
MKVKVAEGANLHEPTVEGRIHRPGAVITVEDKRAEQLISAGCVVKHVAPEPAPGKDAKGEGKPGKDAKGEGK